MHTADESGQQVVLSIVSCSSQTDSNPVSNVLLAEEYKTWISKGASADVTFSLCPPSPICGITLVNAGSVSVSIFGLEEEQVRLLYGDNCVDKDIADSISENEHGQWQAIRHQSVLRLAKEVADDKHRCRRRHYTTLPSASAATKLPAATATSNWRFIKIICEGPPDGVHGLANVQIFTPHRDEAGAEEEGKQAGAHFHDVPSDEAHCISPGVSTHRPCKVYAPSESHNPALNQVPNQATASKACIDQSHLHASSHTAAQPRTTRVCSSPPTILKRPRSVDDESNYSSHSPPISPRSLQDSPKRPHRITFNSKVENTLPDTASMQPPTCVVASPLRSSAQPAANAHATQSTARTTPAITSTSTRPAASAPKSTPSVTMTNPMPTVTKTATAPAMPTASTTPARRADDALKGVKVVISGILNPDRATLREIVLRMGGEYAPDWGRGCTHLICAFPNTPKYKQVSQLGGIIVSPQWLEECESKSRKVKEANFLM